MEDFTMALLVFAGCILNAYAGYRLGLKKGIRHGMERERAKHQTRQG